MSGRRGMCGMTKAAGAHATTRGRTLSVAPL